jgi:hypothetical protein
MEGIITEYLRSLREDLKELPERGTGELSYRPNLTEFLKRMAEQSGLKIIHEAKKGHGDKPGMPDWRIWNKETEATHSWIEHKKVEPERDSIDWVTHMPQIQMYLKRGEPVILTDGVDFVFWDPETAPESPRIERILERPFSVERWAPTIEGFGEVFSEFLGTPRFHNCSLKGLMRKSAKMGKILRKDLLKLSRAPLGSGKTQSEEQAIRALRGLREALGQSHDDSLLQIDKFADFICQIKIFAGIYSHKFMEGKGLDARRVSLKDFWRKEASVRGAFLSLMERIDGILSMHAGLNDWKQRFEEMVCQTAAAAEMNYEEAYEEFLIEYDPKTRKDFGAFLTPVPLAEALLRLSEEIVWLEFNRRLLEEGNKVIDMCMGTGTFFDTVMKQPVSACLQGIEILPTPYIIAHLRLGGEKPFKGTYSLFMANTLEMREKAEDKQSLSDSKQAEAAIKQPIMLITGNPPCTKGQRGGAEIQALLAKWGEELGGGAKSNRKKALQNDWVRFLAWACLQVLSGPIGLISVIVPNTMLGNPSFLGMRRWIRKNFSSIWVLEFDEDLRRGGTGGNLFKSQQGRTILILTHGAKEARGIGYKSIAGPRETKISRLKTLALGDFETLRERGREEFRPSIEEEGKIPYEKFWRVSQVFQSSCSGLKLAPTGLVVHPFAETLLRRSHELAAEGSRGIQNWFAGTKRPPPKTKLTELVREALGKAAEVGKYERYTLRPFTESYLLLDQGLIKALEKAPGGGGRIRPQLINDFRQKGVFGLGIAPAPADIQSSVEPYISFCWNLPDGDLSKRGSARIFTNKTKGRSNINPILVEQLQAVGSIGVEDDVMFYTLAVLSSALLLKRYTQFQVCVIEDLRIPIVRDQKTFREITRLGKRLAELERDPEYAPDEDGVSLTRVRIKKNLILLESESRVEEIEVPEDCLTISVNGHPIVKTWLKYRTSAYSNRLWGDNGRAQLRNLISRLEERVEICGQLDQIIAGWLQSGEVIPPPETPQENHEGRRQHPFQEATPPYQGEEEARPE